MGILFYWILKAK
uniref:Uncharacterized protein n=1 Tax=Rhizophora mucronata TaxID=61149 RepID=A0A2P2PY55_RHIMU